MELQIRICFKALSCSLCQLPKYKYLQKTNRNIKRKKKELGQRQQGQFAMPNTEAELPK